MFGDADTDADAHTDANQSISYITVHSVLRQCHGAVWLLLIVSQDCLASFLYDMSILCTIV